MWREILTGTATLDAAREWSRGEIRLMLRRAIAQARRDGCAWGEIEDQVERVIHQLQHERLN